MMSGNTDLSNGSEWELSKENVQPLKRGRKVANLSAALGSNSNDYHLKIHREKQKFEADIRTYEGEDPLEVWYRYFIWLCENFPTGGKDQTALLESCITVFKDEEKYKNDQRYLEIWMRYADLCTDPIDVFEYLHSQSICSQLANFYESWAYILEELGNLKKADEVYRLGIAKNAEPLEILQRQHRAFEKRLAENLTRDVQSVTNENEPQRTALVGLKRHGKKGMVGVKRTGSATLSSKVGGLGQSKPSGNSKNAGFTIFCEDDVSGMNSLPPSTGEWQMPPTKPITTKENTRKPGKWNESKLPQKHQRTVPVDNICVKPSFTVHVDEEILDKPPCTPQHGHVMVDKVLSSRKPDKDPTSELLRNMAKGDKDESKFKVMYCKEKIYAGAKEFTFEQLRAARMFSKLDGRPWSSLYPKEENQKDKKLFKVMYPKDEVYTFDGERPLDEVLLKRYFASKARREQAQTTHVANYQIPTNNFITNNKEMSSERSEPMDFASCQKIVPNPADNGPIMASLQVYHDEDNYSENHSARRGLSFGKCSSLEAQSSLKDKIYHDVSPNPEANTALPTSASGSAFQPVPKGQSRKALTDRTVPCEEPVTTAVSTTDNIENRLPSTAMQQSLPSSNSAFNTISQPPFHQVTPGNKGVAVRAFGRHTPGSMDNYYASPTVTMNTKAAQDVVLAMFNHPLGVDGDDNLPWTKPQQLAGPEKDFEAAFCNDNKTETMTAMDFGAQGPTFTPYTDPETETQGHLAQENIFDENQENRPPSDYFQQKTKRPVLGVLQPSIGIPVCPLEEEHEQDMYDDENLPPQGDQDEKTADLDDKTRDVTEDANGFMATSSFKMAARMASTPFCQGLDPPSFVMSTIRPPNEHDLDFASAHRDAEYTANTFNCTPNKILSPIFERSDEDTRSTTGSSTASSGRGSLSHHFPSTTNQLASIAEDQRCFSESHSSEIVHNDDQYRSLHQDQNGNQSVARPSASVESTLLQFNEDGTTELNPFSDEVIEKLLGRVVPPVSSYDGYYISNKDDLPKMAPNLAVNLGDDDLYQVERCIGTGAFSKVYSAIKLNADLTADDFDNDNEVTLKVQKTPSDWEFYVCRQLHMRIDKMGCGREMHALFMNPTENYHYVNGSVLVDQYNRAGTLLDVANRYKTSGKSINEHVAVLFVISLLRMLKTMHRCNIIHGDLKPDNILVLDSELFEDGMDLKLIDFGRSIDLQLFPSGTSFKVNCFTDGFQCIEMKTNRPWTTQIDTYGLIGSLYCLIHGEYMKEYQTGEGRWKQNKSFKRHWNCQLWIKLFDCFLNHSNQNEVPSLTEQLLGDFEDLYRSMNSDVVQGARKEFDILMTSG